MISIYKDIKIDKFILEEVEKKRSQLLLEDNKTGFGQLIGLVENNSKKIEKWFYDITGKNIKTYSSWTNFVTFSNIDNGYEWHEDVYDTRLGYSKEENDKKLLEKPLKGTYTSVVWIDGVPNKGGSLSIMTNESVEVFEFEKNTIITFPMNFYHKVERYYADDFRISMNFTFDYI